MPTRTSQSACGVRRLCTLYRGSLRLAGYFSSGIPSSYPNLSTGGVHAAGTSGCRLRSLSRSPTRIYAAPPPIASAYPVRFLPQTSLFTRPTPTNVRFHRRILAAPPLRSPPRSVFSLPLSCSPVPFPLSPHLLPSPALLSPFPSLIAAAMCSPLPSLLSAPVPSPAPLLSSHLSHRRSDVLPCPLTCSPAQLLTFPFSLPALRR